MAESEPAVDVDSVRLIRSFLYVPGDRDDRVAKALASEADAVIIDLEDAVAASAKRAARSTVAVTLAAPGIERRGLWVRINAGEEGLIDLDSIGAVDRLEGIIVAKCDGPDRVDQVSALIPRAVRLAPLIESARAARLLLDICGHPRVQQCQLGEVDLIAETGARGRGAAKIVDSVRIRAVLASAEAQILPPIGGVYTDVADLDGLREESEGLASMGFDGRPAIHPAQVSIINEAFEARAEDVAAAKLIIETYDNAQNLGRGVLRTDDGQMVDEAVVRSARRVVLRQQPRQA